VIVSRKLSLVLLSLVLAVSAVLRFYRLGDAPLWIDETFGLRFAEVPLSGLWADATDIHPPLYYSLQRIWLLFGRTEFAVRSLSAVLGVLGVLLTYKIGCAVGRRSTGLLAALLLGVSPTHIFFSQTARPYVALITAATLSVLGALRLIQSKPTAALLSRGNAGCLLAYVAGTTAALYLHNTAALLPVLVNLVVLPWWFLHLRSDRRFLAVWALANVAVLALWSWWLPVLATQTTKELQGFWLARPAWQDALEMAATVNGQTYLGVEINPLPWAPLFVAPLVVLALLGALKARMRWRAALLVAISAGVPLLTYILSFRTPIYLHRTLLWSIPSFLTLVSLGVGALGGLRWKRGRVIAAAAVLGGLVSALPSYYGRPIEEPWDDLVRVVQQSAGPGSLVLFCTADLEIPFSYYAERSGLQLPTLAIVRPPEPRWQRYLYEEPIGRVSTVDAAHLDRAIAAFREVWFVGRFCVPRLEGDWNEVFRHSLGSTARLHVAGFRKGAERER
jgi:4-amino-4-deoxy-L-arabinose transferase-like glycosyltransferase